VRIITNATTFRHFAAHPANLPHLTGVLNYYVFENTDLTVSFSVYKDYNESNDSAEQTDDHAATVDGEPNSLATHTIIGPHGLVVLSEDESRTSAHHVGNQHQATWIIQQPIIT